MKSTSIKYLPALLAILLFVSCGEPNKSTPTTEPIYTSHPVLKHLTETIAKEPKNSLLYYQRGKLLYKMKYDTLALKDFKTASELDTNQAEYYSAVGDILFESKDIAGSAVWLEKAMAKNPEDPRAHLKIAKLFLYTRDYPKAFEQINIVLRKDVYNPEAYFLKGMVYKDMNDTTKAISSFQSALQVAPDYKQAVVQLGLLYSARGNPLAIKYLDNASLLDTMDVFPTFARGVYYQGNKEYEKAKAEYKKCIIKDRHYIDAYFNMGAVYMLQDSVEKALRYYDMVAKVQPDNPTAYYDRGVCHELMKNMKEAVMDYRRAAALDTAYKSPKDALKRLASTSAQ